MKLTEALKMAGAVTENGMATNTTSLNYNVDLFFKGGAMRAAEEADMKIVLLVFVTFFGSAMSVVEQVNVVSSVLPLSILLMLIHKEWPM